ncbi:rod shape-determining protein MreD [Paenibacillus catalpae]|uniref:Rod shape-determining protein MreD n=1 Tax=Paenibacillus catalpae TaxID=1045775 RepID=A0A1I1YXS7_9BACL|nr:rod shape-determining protein MreD [Paenibacillus catalpae]SFE24257.1 rod shape-determining protein MreD [Paenibacillus catalpae]
MGDRGINRLILVMLLLFLVEGTLMPWLIPVELTGRIVPHFMFVFVIFAALYSGRHRALFFGISFGFLQDVIYFGHLMGVNAFAMGLIGYYTGVLLERRRSTLLTALSVIGLGCILYDTIVYFVNMVFRVTNETYAWALMDHILPSLFLQLVFALAVYVPARRLFESHLKLNPETEEE